LSKTGPRTKQTTLAYIGNSEKTDFRASLSISTYFETWWKYAKNNQPNKEQRIQGNFRHFTPTKGKSKA
jgi:hypothetical protein